MHRVHLDLNIIYWHIVQYILYDAKLNYISFLKKKESFLLNMCTYIIMHIKYVILKYWIYFFELSGLFL